MGAGSTRESGRLGPPILATVLAAAAGATNAISFLGLGGVFTSVMTGNLVLLGLSAGRPDPALAGQAAGAFAGFIAGVLAGSRAMGPVVVGHPDWPRRMTVALGVELLLLTVLTAAWAVTGGRPEPGGRPALIVVASLAMGVQSGVARGFGIAGLSTTFFTGTLTGVLGGLVTQGGVRPHNVAPLAALAAGAAGGGWLTLHAAAVAPALPTALVAAGLAVPAVLPPPLTVRPG
ncbi:DUF1275 family protein [Microbispora sp. NPDC049125]|uniref:DUF1275 family protein n=1 Tax=Microbispora sp. NPDC049125 TaxID=3154929 RepID=UPI00346617F5